MVGVAILLIFFAVGVASLVWFTVQGDGFNVGGFFVTLVFGAAAAMLYMSLQS